MIEFAPYEETGLYLTQAEISDPSTARVGFLFQDSGRHDAGFQLSQASWTASGSQGFFLFFRPSATRDWASFAEATRAQFEQNTPAQFGWFLESDGSTSMQSFLPVSNQGTSLPSAQTFSLIFRNITVTLATDIFGAPATISFDDIADTFVVVNQVGQTPALSITVTPPSGNTQTYQSPSPNMTLGVVGGHSGAVNAAFQLGTDDLAQFEAGLMYFAPGVDGRPLEALRYPTFRTAGDGTAPLNLNVWLDVLEPVDGARSYFLFADARIGSYFASATGRPVAFLTNNGADASRTSRLVLANRPVQSAAPSQYYYLTPAGPFSLAVDAAGGPTNGTPPPASGVALLCGVTGTEFLQATAAPSGDSAADGAIGAADTLTFVPAQPALRTTSNGTGPPVYLEDGEGNATTSWVQFVTASGSYVSQPEQSPLYQQNGSTSSPAAGAPAGGATSGPGPYLLDFLPLETWSAAAVAAGDTVEAAAPAVPLAPYSGIPFATDPNLHLDQFLAMEAIALNPTRRNAFTAAAAAVARPQEEAEAGSPLTFAMTPQGLLAGLSGEPPMWSTLQMATSAAGTLQFQNIGTDLRQVLQQNQIFAVISTTGKTPGSLFDFSDSSLEIGDWTFDLSPDHTMAPNGTPPILLLKFYPGKSIQSLVDDISLWSKPGTFNLDPFDVPSAQKYLKKVIADACAQVYEGGCPDGKPSGQPNTSSLYYNFYQAVTDPNFNGILAVNCNIQLNKLPSAIKAVLGGMQDPGIDSFRVHHAGVQINDTDPGAAQPTLAQSSLFALVDYTAAASPTAPAAREIDFYKFKIEYLRALFTNSELRNFSCRIQLTIDGLFGTSVNLNGVASSGPRALGCGGADAGNAIAITGSYQAHSSTDDTTTSGEGVYSFVAEGNFTFEFKDKDGADTSPYLQSITLTKLQFSFDQETPVGTNGPATTTHISSSFGIWGSMVFKNLDVLDIFSFEKLVFADLGIKVGFDLTIYDDGKEPSTSGLALAFSPGNLRLDLGQTTTRPSATSLLSLIPFKLKSFLYSEKGQTLESLKYYGFSSIAGLSGIKDSFNYGLIFDLDLGSMGGLVGSLSAFKFSILIGWLDGNEEGIAFGVQLPQADGKLEITIQGVLTISIKQFTLLYATDTTPAMLVLGLQEAYMEVFGVRLPPSGTISFGLFAPTAGAAEIGWIAAYNGGQDGGAGGDGGGGSGGGGKALAPGGGASPIGEAGDDEASPFELVYLGAGQRTGPDPKSPPTTFADFLKFMQGEFWTNIKDKKFDQVYHPDGGWLALTDFKLLGIVEVGVIFYDSLRQPPEPAPSPLVTPFYSLVLNVTNFFNFEITYTKVTDTIGLFYANLTLPDSLRTFEVGAASVTLPAIGVSVYTNGNWKLDVGFPVGDDWSRSFQVEAMAGPVPVTGAGGFYLASLSSATDPKVFKGTYASILAFGLGARLGVGKDFTAGPLKAGISVTFFGIIEGAAGYHMALSTKIFQEPDALSLKGQFGIIGELYGSLDFVIVKASVNVRLSASIGIVLQLEPAAGDDGSILLYIQASVNVSVTVTINLLFFSVHISFSFKATFRFEWRILGSSGAAAARSLVRAGWGERSLAKPAPLALCPGLNSAVPLWFLPELTVVFADATSAGVPWFCCSLGIEYDNEPPANPTFQDLPPFEAVATQLVTFALSHVLGLSGCSSTVTLSQLQELDESPDLLVGWIDYPTLLGQLAAFQFTVSAAQGQQGQTYYRSVFPMFPFLRLQTTGRLEGSGKADELDYQFLAKNPVTPAYIQTVDAYFNQLFVNQAQGDQASLTADPDAAVPLVQEIFLDYFTGLIRGAIHQLLQTMQGPPPLADPSALDDLICRTVGAGGFTTLAGQMSSSFRGGARLPYLDGQTVPGGPADTDTNALYALQWQEFPVGQFGTAQRYTVGLANPDTTAPWVTSSISYSLTTASVSPYQGLHAGDVAVPSAPSQLPFTDTGPQAFPFQNAIVWTQAGQPAPVSLRPFPTNLAQLEAALQAPIRVLVQSRDASAPYLSGGTPLAPADFTWATMVQLSVAQVPAASGSETLADVYAVSGANQADQLLLSHILAANGQGTAQISSIQVLYQTAAGASGLTSGDTTTDPQNVFLLRTNTTTLSAPPTGLDLLAAPRSGDVAVGAAIDDYAGFLQILEQAAVTNAPGYYLRYRDAQNNALPTDLFSAGPASLTVLVEYTSTAQNQPGSPASVLPYYSAIVLANATAGPVYYAETTDAALDMQHVSVAAGSVGMQLTRSEAVLQVRAPEAVAAVAGLAADQPVSRTELLANLHRAGVTDEEDVRRALAAAGTAASDLNALYSLVTYEVQPTTGFVKSNLSAPIPPQKPDAGDRTSTYRAFVPLPNVALANQGLPPGQPPDAYASLPDPFSVDFFVNDAFGNQLPNTLAFAGTNCYFDPIIPVDQWLGVVPTYDFVVDGKTEASSLTCYLTPSAAAFSAGTDQTSTTLPLYRSIYDQITGPGVSLYLETNLALQADGTMVQVMLTQAQVANVVNMVKAIVDYLEGNASAPPAEVPLSVTVSGPGPLPPVFEIGVLFGVRRDPSLISPLLKDGFGNVTFPSAQNVNCAVASKVGVTVGLNTLAADFVQAFPALTLSVALTGAAQPVQRQSSTGLSKSRLRRAAMASDGSGDSHAAAQSLWAAQTVLLEVTIGAGASAGPRYLSPKPLDNTLNSATVPLPALANPLPQLPTSSLFVDIDLDQFNRSFFQAVDNVLAPASAAQAFESVPAAYSTITTGREALAQEYANFEVDWLFSPASPFTGTVDQLAVAQEVFEQQMRAALMTAYSVDTIVQYDGVWPASVPAAADGMLELFGQVQTAPDPSGAPSNGAPSSAAGLSTAHVAVTSGGTSPLTFLYGVPDVQDTAEVTFANGLQLNVTHLQLFLVPKGQTPPGQARPSIWLQLVDPCLPSIGPARQPVVVPIVYRQYPTPPSVLSQAWRQGTPLGISTDPNPIVEGAVWDLLFSYQAQLTPHDRIDASVTYNTDLSASPSGPNGQFDDAPGDSQFTLFEALARFTATYAALQGILEKLADPNWAAAVSAFADRVTEVVGNSDWNPSLALAAAGPLRRVVDRYSVTDLPQGTGDIAPRLITLAWPTIQGESSFPGVALTIQAADPTSLQPYPNQTLATGPTDVTDTYQPNPALIDDWALHQVAVESLNVLAAENGLAGVAIERNLVALSAPDGTTWYSKDEFVYTTPTVRAPQPVTPFIVNSAPIDVAKLPGQGAGAGCPSPAAASLCQRVYTMMNDLLADPQQISGLLAAHVAAELEATASRRVKVACSYSYPVPAVTGGAVGLDAIRPLVPVVLARSFVIDATQPDQISAFAQTFATAIDAWCTSNGIAFGSSAQPPGAELVFDITLYAQLSGVNTPVLECTKLELKLTDVEPAPVAVAAGTSSK